MTIEVHNDFFTNELYTQLNDYSEWLLSSPQNNMGLLSNFCWPNNIVYDSSTILIGGFSNKPFENECVKIAGEIVGSSPLIMMYYYWTPMSHIPWHNDEIYSCAMTIYLNQTWDKNNGGLFLYEEGNEIRCIMPKVNRAVIQKNNTNHAVTCLTKNSPIRRTIQLFWPR